jgi:hypothetical protein
MAVNRPIQRFNIFNRAKKHLGEDAKYFMPAPRAIGSLSQIKPSLYPHLEGQSGFRSIKQKRLEAIKKRNETLLERTTNENQALLSSNSEVPTVTKSFSETINDDRLIIQAGNSLPQVIKTVTTIEPQTKAPSSDLVNQVDATFLPTDQLEPEVRELLDAGAVQPRHQPDPRLTQLVKRPKPLQLNPINRPAKPSELESKHQVQQIESADSVDIPPINMDKQDSKSNLR